MRMYSIQETVDILRLCRQTIYKLIREGELSAKKSSGVRGKWLISAESIDRYIKSDEFLIFNLLHQKK